MNAKHTPETWIVFVSTGSEKRADTFSNSAVAEYAVENAFTNGMHAVAMPLARAEACVNALSGIADPEAAIKAAREALSMAKFVARKLAACGISIGHSGPAEARIDAALALLTPAK